MKTDSKHYQFVNSQTGNTIYYHSLSISFTEDELRAELDKIKGQVATQNGLPIGIIYWEEVKNAN
ncbi:hypothetical protein [Mucilaginibacter myungsuensis]|uniref:Uncharacterized protein n=1 Tax=Mucilaginibacter myungsuensis TaxID=649104 RepID=A0A929PXW8_9SPHI|nr:hypothetical protein [Mucilaginibacter myungsuensis]MBE9664293.1 hypothetical protein [Mucilaginibacter myungsuensis]MDN3599997.1 hypothetical protein [Mucilaginibacter myungsuensis]